MTVILHIGAHKTATTAIQSSFELSRKRLASLGVIYPQCNWYHHGQHRLAFAMRGKTDRTRRDRPDLTAEISELNKAIAQSGSTSRIFVSSEEMFAAPRESIVALRGGLCRSEVKIVAFLRRPDDLFLSIYNQFAKDPRNNFKAPTDHFLENPARLHADLAARKCVENWAETFGHDRIFLRRYEDGSPLAEILRILNLPDDAVPASSEANRSVPAAVCEVMRIAKITEIDPELRRRLFKVANRVFAGKPKLELGATNRRKILSEMQADFDALFTQFGMENVYRADLVDDDTLSPTALRPVQWLAQVIEALLRES